MKEKRDGYPVTSHPLLDKRGCTHIAQRMAVSCYEKIRSPLIFGLNLVFKNVC